MRTVRIITATFFAVALAWALAPAGAGASVAGPDLRLDKASTAAGPLGRGDVFMYTLTVANVGTSAAHDVTVSDRLPRGLSIRTILPQLPGGTCSVTSSQLPPAPPVVTVLCTRDVLAAGTDADVSFDVRVTGDAPCGVLVNTAKTRAGDEPAANRSDDTASTTDEVGCPPSIALAVSAPPVARAGQPVPITMTVRNTGGLPLTAVQVHDGECDRSPRRTAGGNGDATLSPGERWTYRCSIPGSGAGRHTTTATVTAASSNGPAHASAKAVTRVVDPALSIDVRPTPASGSPGDTITYRYVVTNTGDATIRAISVEDDRLGHVGDIARLVPGHTETVVADRVLTATNVWVVDTATASGVDPAGYTVRAYDSASVTIVAPVARGTSGRGAPDGTAFTGVNATAASVVAVLLAAQGSAALVAARRRRV